MTAMMEEILIEPTEEWLPEAAAYKRAFEAAGDSMDGTGSPAHGTGYGAVAANVPAISSAGRPPRRGWCPPRSSYMCARRIMRCWACCRCGMS